MIVRKIGIVFWIFMLIYSPRFCRVNTLYIIGGFSWLYILFFYRKTLTSMKNKSTRFLYMSLGCFLIYGLFNSLIHLKFAKQIISPAVYWGGIVFPSFYLIANKCFDNYIDNEEKFIKLLLAVGNMQGIASLFLFLFPEMRYRYLSFLDMNGIAKEGLIEIVASYRYYGFSSSIITYMPLVQIVLALMAIWLFERTQKKRYLFYFPLLAFSAFINARTPIVIFAVGIIMLILFMNKNGKHFLYSLSIIAIIILFIVCFYSSLKNTDTVYNKWFLDGITSIIETIQGKESYGERTGLVFVLPKSFTIWLVGIGSTIVGKNPYGQATDMGYANYIWLGGILYMAILFLVYFLMAKSMIRLGVDPFVVGLLYMAILVFSYKMPVLYDNEFMRLFYAIYIWNVIKMYRRGKFGIFKNKRNCVLVLKT